MPWGYALCSYCVGGTKYAVGIRSMLVLCRGYQICRGIPNILRIISMGVPDILGYMVPDILGYMVRGCQKPGKPNIL